MTVSRFHRPPLGRPALAWACLGALLLASCAGTRRPPSDNAPTLASLSKREVKVDVAADPGVQGDGDQTLAAYRRFLEVAPAEAQREEVTRRLGDLEMDQADRRAAQSPDPAGSSPDYSAAISRYQTFLKNYPNDPHNDRVLYQLARAQEQNGQLEPALATLTQLVTRFPGTEHADEAQFRRGEMLFALRDYKQAGEAYAAVLQAAPAAAPGASAGSASATTARTPFHDRALYMRGWSLFKQGRLDEALQPFFGVLDLKLAGLSPTERETADLATVRSLSRGDRELLDDTFRVMSISLSSLQGPASVPPYIDSPLREGYEFRVYQQLGEFYVRQQRIKDAADTFATFVRRQPLHAQAPVLLARVIQLDEQNGFESLALQAKEEHVQRYGAASEFKRANPSGWRAAQPLVRANLADLAHYHHALAQKGHDPAEVAAAARWYHQLLTDFADDPDTPNQRFLLAELLFDGSQWAQAAGEYETVAYQDPHGAHSADAGYAALLAYAKQEPAAADAKARAALQHQAAASALRFAAAFPADPRAGAVLTHAADQLYALGEGALASTVARQALALQPPPSPELQRTDWTVIAHQAFEQGAFADAEKAYGEVLARTPASGPGAADRDAIALRQAAAVYKQGELARDQGDARAAVANFQRVAALGSSSATASVRASASFDAAAALIGLKDWAAAASALEDFRRQFPGHPLQAEVAPKLALADLQLGRDAAAADEFERVAAQAQAPDIARGALWQAAELRQKAAADAPPKSPLLGAAIVSWTNYVQRWPQPLEANVDARARLATLSRQNGQAAQALAWTRSVQQADLGAGDARTPRTRLLGGQATLVLAEPLLDDYRRVRLVEPLAKQLKLKKAKMESVLQAYAAAAEVGVAEVTTEATFSTGALYQDFGRALIDSARPKRLSKDELEQYNVMLEEQAFPFEEKAIALYETDARRAQDGVYDRWVQQSFDALAKLKPVRWGKAERGDASLPADKPALDAALQAAPPADPRRPALLNQLGIAERRLGHFEPARKAYEQAIALAPQSLAPQLNLAILEDLYLGDPAKAQVLYQHCAELSPADAPQLGKWLAEIKARKPVPSVATGASAAASGSAAVASRKESP
jgi:tetratricopeptide (TPR) repeat protein